MEYYIAMRMNELHNIIWVKFPNKKLGQQNWIQEILVYGGLQVTRREWERKFWVQGVSNSLFLDSGPGYTSVDTFERQQVQ